jgi:hypothetical protein
MPSDADLEEIRQGLRDGATRCSPAEVVRTTPGGARRTSLGGDAPSWRDAGGSSDQRQRPIDCELIIRLTSPTSSDMLFWLGGNSSNDFTNSAILGPACPRIQLRFSAHSS